MLLGFGDFARFIVVSTNITRQAEELNFFIQKLEGLFFLLFKEKKEQRENHTIIALIASFGILRVHTCLSQVITCPE